MMTLISLEYLAYYFIYSIDKELVFYHVFNFSYGTIDVNFFEFQYLADHLTGKECIRLVASLHFHSFSFPKDIDAAERRIPDDVPCIDLLTHWNSAPKEGRGETHAAICHRLNQIGREDLAKWLSKTVSHEISKDLRNALSPEKHTDAVAVVNLREPEMTETPRPVIIIDEAAWWEMDSLLEILIVFCTVMLLFGSIFLVFLCCKRSSKPSYEKVNTHET